MTMNETLASFVDGYITAALWSSTDDHGEALDQDPDARDLLTPETLASIQADCADFYDANYQDIKDDPARAGADFWLTRNRHGAGFWDGDWPEAAGKRLTENAHPYGESDLYVGDDGKLYVTP